MHEQYDVYIHKEDVEKLRSAPLDVVATAFELVKKYDRIHVEDILLDSELHFFWNILSINNIPDVMANYILWIGDILHIEADIFDDVEAKNPITRDVNELIDELATKIRYAVRVTDLYYKLQMMIENGIRVILVCLAETPAPKDYIPLKNALFGILNKESVEKKKKK